MAMVPRLAVLLAASWSILASTLVLRRSSVPKETQLHSFSICPRYVAARWNTSSDAAKVRSAYNEVLAVNSTGHTMFAALSTNLGAMGLLRDKRGQSYAYMSAYGSAADAVLLASGDEVDVVHTPAPPAAHGYLTFKGIEAVVELDKDDVAFGNGSAKPLAFLMQLELSREAFNWRGWPRSFSYTLTGYVHLPSRGIWRLLSATQGRVVTDGNTNFAGFLGGFGSFVAPLGEGKACADGGGEGRFGTAWYQTSDGKEWNQFQSSVANAPGKDAAGQEASLMVAAHSSDAFAKVAQNTRNKLVPSLLHDFPLPEGDNSPASHKSNGFRNFGPKQERLRTWGQYYNETRVYSCITPDLAAVMADPHQYQPPPKKVPDFDKMGLCEPLVAEHFWWTPQPVALQDIEWFYNEITVEESAPYTYFMANGFSGGYMGIQEHPGGKKYALFSIWDAGSKVEIVDWGEGVRVGRFGAEGTGANSNLDFQWEIGKAVQFLVHVQVEPPREPGGQRTALYSGYIRLPDRGVWRLMSKLRVQPCGVNVNSKGNLLGMNSFIEVFQHLPKQGTPECDAYSVTRRARYGVPWYRRVGSSTFEPFVNVTLTTTCGKEGCPRRGMDFQKVAVDGYDAFALAVGKDVVNEGLALSRPQPMHAAKDPPPVLTETPLPESDNSPAGRWKVWEAHPLRSLGRHEQMARWGSGPDELACPWYVQDCTLPPGLPDDGHGLR
jgi:hypothetical protein